MCTCCVPARCEALGCGEEPRREGPGPWGPCSWCEGANQPRGRGGEGCVGGVAEAGGRCRVTAAGPRACPVLPGPVGTRRSVWLRALPCVLGPLPSCPVTWRLRKAGLAEHGLHSLVLCSFLHPTMVSWAFPQQADLGGDGGGLAGWDTGLAGAAGDPSPGLNGAGDGEQGIVGGRRKPLTRDEEGFLEEALSALGAEWTPPAGGVGVHKGLGGRGQWEKGCSSLQPPGWGGAGAGPAHSRRPGEQVRLGAQNEGPQWGRRPLSPDPGRVTARRGDLWVLPGTGVPGGPAVRCPLLVTRGIPGAEVWEAAERVVGVGSGGPGTPSARGGSGRLLPLQAVSFL